MTNPPTTGPGAPVPAGRDGKAFHMRLTVLHNDDVVSETVCGAEAIYLGSADGCRVQLADTRIAPRQVVVLPTEEGGWQLTRLSAGCEIRVNDTPLDETLDLYSGDEIRILDFTIRVEPEYEDQPGPRKIGTTRAQLEAFAQSQLPPSAHLRKANEPITVQPTHLDALGRANVAAGGCSTPEALMDAALQHMIEAYAAKRVWIGLRRANFGRLDYEEGRLLTGQPTDMPALCHDLMPRVLDRGQFVLIPRISRQDRTSVLSGPLLTPDGPQGMIYIDSGPGGRRYLREDLEHFVLHLNVFAYQLHAINRMTARMRAAMVDGQVSVAHDIQARLTPRKLPQWEGQLGFGAFREPGRQHSGDIYDVVRLANNLAAFMIARTSAAGALPSMLMVQAQTAFRSAVMHQDNPGVTLRMLNWLIYDGQKDHPLECLVGVVDPASGAMRYASAGSLGAVLIGQSGEPRRLGYNEPMPPLGASKTLVYPILSEELAPSETLALFTPGVLEARNREDKPFGEERFLNILCDGFGQSAGALLAELMTELRNFTAGVGQSDDLTVILGHRN